MKKSELKDTFDKIMLAYPSASSLVCYTEAVLICNPKPEELIRNFRRYVDRVDYKDMTTRETLRDTFGDMLMGKHSKKEERLAWRFWNLD